MRFFSAEPPKKKQLRYQVTEFEISLVLEAYYSDRGWEEVLKFVRRKLRTAGQGNSTTAHQVMEYYLEYSTSKAAIKRLQRIVGQNMKKTDECLVQEGQSSRMSLIIKDSKTYYSKKCDPDQRKLTKFEQCPNLNDSSPSESVDEQHYDRYMESDNSNNTSDMIIKFKTCCDD